MKPFIFILCLVFITQTVSATQPILATEDFEIQSQKKRKQHLYGRMKTKLEKVLGRKLKIKERLGLFVFSRKVRKTEKGINKWFITAGLLIAIGLLFSVLFVSVQFILLLVLGVVLLFIVDSEKYQTEESQKLASKLNLLILVGLAAFLLLIFLSLLLYIAFILFFLL